MNHRKVYVRCLVNVFVFVSLILSAAIADVKLPSIIGDNMVLQQKMEVPIWGWASPGEKIIVETTWSSAQISTKADKAGKWMVKLKTPKTGKIYEITIQGNNRIVIKNVLIGEVWVCSGQSNMQWEVKMANDANAEIAAADYPNIRIFSVQRNTSQQPQSDCVGRWQVCSPKTAGDFSAVGYFFGRYIHKQLNVPVGLINTSYGGTPAEAWTRRGVLEADPLYKNILDEFKKASNKYPEYIQKLEDWKKEAAKAKAEGKAIPRKPELPYGPEHSAAPSGLYNAMINPLIPYAIRGAIWYQGESNASGQRSIDYGKLFPAMITNWRQDWKQGDFPFYYVQLANFIADRKNPAFASDSWALLRESQLKTLSTPNTGMAVIIDIGDANNIHPTNKQDVGKRLALWALTKTYGKKDIVYSGPLYKSMKVKGDKIVLSFNHTGSGLMIKNSDLLDGFTIAGADQNFVPADASIIDGDVVVVKSSDVTKPVAVRYGWKDNPTCNLFNNEGLPASPFRTDDWSFKFEPKKHRTKK